MIVTASYSYFLLVEMLILPWLTDIVAYKREQPLETRVRSRFFSQKNDAPELSEEILSMGRTIF
jgi:hypothetical protein